MKKIILVLVVCLFSKDVVSKDKPNRPEIAAKAMNDGINTGLDIAIKSLSAIPTKIIGEISKTNKTTVWVNGKSLKECMGENKVLNNNAIQCHNGYFKEVE